MSKISKTIQIIAILSGLFVSFVSFSYPRGCEVTGFAYRDNYLILNLKGEQTFYLIQNQSDKVIEFERYETREVFMSPSLESKLSPKKWSAFAADVENLHFQCYQRQEDERTLVNCQDVLDICEYPRVKFALSNMGNYWVSTNKPQKSVIKESIKKGILLRW